MSRRQANIIRGMGQTSRPRAAVTADSPGLPSRFGRVLGLQVAAFEPVTVY